MKRLLLICISILLLFPCIAFAQTDPIKLIYNGKAIPTDVPPMIIQSRCLVPARAFFEALGASVSWAGDKGEVGITLGNKSITLIIGKNSAYINGLPADMDVPPSIMDGRTMVPVRFISESLGMTVNWDGSQRMVEILSKSAGVINNIEILNDSGNLNVNIELSAPPSRYSAYYLPSPPRLVLDIFGIAPGTARQSTDIGEPGVSKLRVGAHDGYTRLVFDTDRELPFNVVQDKAKTVISIYIALPSDSSAPSPALPSTAPAPKEGMLVAIDPGHGGTDPGATAELDGKKVFEKDLNLDISLRLKKLLEDKGIQVMMTRSSDTAVDLRSRPDLCNASKADLTLCIHNNSIGSADVSGTMTFYAPDGVEPYPISSKRLAEIVQSELVSELKSNDLGVREGGAYVVLKYTRMPAVIVEVGFLTNPDELKKLTTPDYRQSAAQALANAAVKALNEIYANKKAGSARA